MSSLVSRMRLWIIVLESDISLTLVTCCSPTMSETASHKKDLMRSSPIMCGLFVQSNVIRNLVRGFTLFICLLHISCRAQSLSFLAVSFLLKKPVLLTANSLSTFSKRSLNFLGFMLSAERTLLHVAHWGYSTFLSTTFMKPHCRNASLYERFSLHVGAMVPKTSVKYCHKMYKKYKNTWTIHELVTVFRKTDKK